MFDGSTILVLMKELGVFSSAHKIMTDERAQATLFAARNTLRLMVAVGSGITDVLHWFYSRVSRLASRLGYLYITMYYSEPLLPTCLAVTIGNVPCRTLKS